MRARDEIEENDNFDSTVEYPPSVIEPPNKRRGRTSVCNSSDVASNGQIHSSFLSYSIVIPSTYRVRPHIDHRLGNGTRTGDEVQTPVSAFGSP